MAITITQHQRDTLWRDIQLDHTALSDVEKCLVLGDAEGAQELRAQFERHWRLLDDLGWAFADVRDEFTLTMAAPELEKAIRWHRDRVVEALPDSEDADEELDILSACDHVLEQVA
jgi:hypothetical protein